VPTEKPLQDGGRAGVYRESGVGGQLAPQSKPAGIRVLKSVELPATRKVAHDQRIMALFSQSQPSTALPHATLSLLGTVHNLLVGRVRDDHIGNSSGSPSRLEHPRFSYSYEGTMADGRAAAAGRATVVSGRGRHHPRHRQSPQHTGCLGRHTVNAVVQWGVGRGRGGRLQGSGDDGRPAP